MKLKNKKTGKIWTVIEDRNQYCKDDVIELYMKEDGAKGWGAQYFEYPSMKTLNEEWEDYTPDPFEERAQEVLRRYMWEMEYENYRIGQADGGDGRKFRSAKDEWMGRLYAVRDIAKALGIIVEPISDFYPELSDRNNFDPKRHDRTFYSYGFEWEKDYDDLLDRTSERPKQLKVIDKLSYPQDYGAGPGEVIETTYECPCGLGTVTDTHDNIPGFRSHDIFINCDECREKWVVERNGLAHRKDKKWNKK